MEENITLGLPNKIKLLQCPKCKFYLRVPKVWIKLQCESLLFLSFCLTKLNTYITSNQVKVHRAESFPPESNSKSIKSRFYLQKEILNGQTLQQSHLVEFVVDDRVCEPCSRVQANPNHWVYAVQLRKYGSHARSYLHLEHLILKHGAAANAVTIDRMKHGTDYAFAKEACARMLVDFIVKQAPVRTAESKGPVSHDKKSSYYSFGYTFFVQVCSICCEDLIYLRPSVASRLGNIGPVMICSRLTNTICLFDPLTSKQCCLEGDMYWREPFSSLLSSKDLVEYEVLDVKEVCSEVTIDGKKFGLADAEVARVKDLGKNETRFKIKTHLGHLLKKGDHALGYDLWEAKCSGSGIELKEHIGDGVILMKKISKEKLLQKRRAENQVDLEKITNEVLGMSLGSEEPTLEDMLGDLNMNCDEYKEKKKAKRTA